MFVPPRVLVLILHIFTLNCEVRNEIGKQKFPFTTPDPNLLLLWLSRLERSRLLALLLRFKHQLKIWVFTLTQKCHLISRCLKHARLVISIFVPLTTEASKTIAAAIVGSRLDFCNSLLAGTSVSNLTRLQRVQNTLARVVAQKPRFCHITPVHSDFHWLSVRHRISFKIATVTFTMLQSQQPSYLSSLIPRYVPARPFRSSSFSIIMRSST